MANFLKADELATLKYLVRYLTKAQTDKPVDQITADRLARSFRSTMTITPPSEVVFRENMLNLPILTLLQLILDLNARP